MCQALLPAAEDVTGDVIGRPVLLWAEQSFETEGQEL